MVVDVERARNRSVWTLLLEMWHLLVHVLRGRRSKTTGSFRDVLRCMLSKWFLVVSFQSPLCYPSVLKVSRVVPIGVDIASKQPLCKRWVYNEGTCQIGHKTSLDIE